MGNHGLGPRLRHQVMELTAVKNPTLPWGELVAVRNETQKLSDQTFIYLVAFLYLVPPKGLEMKGGKII